MIEALRDAQVDGGAELAEIEGITLPVSFGNDVEVLEDWENRVLLVDRTHWGKILVKDSDRLPFLHNQSSNDLKILKPGQGCDTVFLTSTARTIDLTTAYVLEDAVLLLTSPNRCQQLFTNLDKYIFFADRVQLTNASDDYAIFNLIGAASFQILEKLGINFPLDQPYGTHQEFTMGDITLRVAIGSSLATPGYTLIVPLAQAAQLWQQLVNLGIAPIGTNLWETLRILQGRPAADAELTEDYNPLEAGLLQTISFNKGCYIGQETIARLETYKGVKQNLWGISLAAPATPGEALMLDGEKVGKLTSYTKTTQGCYGLAYLRTKAGGVGLQVQVGNTTGEIVDVPFLTHVSSM
jgi:tRNA-modifying protein YgfZ